MIISFNTCRLCLILVGKENHVSLFCSNISGNLPKKIMEVADVQVSEGDGLPSVICPSCFAQIELSHQFKLQVEKADKILREEISVNAALHNEDESEECEGVENENVEINTNSMFKEENNGIWCIYEVKNAGGNEEMDIGEDEENHENGKAGEMLNKDSEENIINTGCVSESQKKASNGECFSKEINNCDNSPKKKTKSVKKKIKVKIYTQNTVYKCDICDKSYKLKQMLNFHRKIHYENHKCDICGKAFSSKPDMENHRRIHSDERPFSCEQCGKSFKQEFGLKSHINVHNNTDPVPCTLCGKLYKTKSGLQFHRRTQHSKNGPSFVCEICGKCFMENAALCSHKVTHEGKPLTCEICNKTYPHTRALRTHKRTVHLVSNRFCCDVCGKHYKHYSILKTHKVTHTGQKPHICNICGFAFTQKSAMKTHMKVHTGLEPYSCQYCGQSFKWKQTYDKHVLKCSEKRSTSNTKVTENSSTTENSNITENSSTTENSNITVNSNATENSNTTN